jgi:hypothetical protein
VKPSSAYPPNQEAVVDAKLDHGIQGLFALFQQHLQLE